MPAARAFSPAGCSGKIRYATEAEARRAIDGIRARTGQRCKTVPYRCDYCASFHFGRRPGAIPEPWRRSRPTAAALLREADPCE